MKHLLCKDIHKCLIAFNCPIFSAFFILLVCILFWSRLCLSWITPMKTVKVVIHQAQRQTEASVTKCTILIREIRSKGGCLVISVIALSINLVWFSKFNKCCWYVPMPGERGSRNAPFKELVDKYDWKLFTISKAKRL